MKKRIYAAIAGILIIILIIAFGALFAVNDIVEVYEDGADASNLQSGSISELAGISLGDNILGINETAAKNRVSDYYPDNSIDIYDIERVFPNKVIIKIKQRLPVVAISMQSGGYALADIDFQLNKKVEKADSSALIFAYGVTVSNTFNTPSLKRLREAMIAAKSVGFTDQGITAFIAEITIQPDGNIIYKLRSGGVITAGGEGQELQNIFSEKYSQYINLTDNLRPEAYL